MKHDPQIQQRAAQPYVAVRMPVTMEGLAEAVDTSFPEVFGRMANHGVAPAGPPFVRYLVIDMVTELEIELAVPVEGEAEGGGRVRFDVLPAGRYVTLRHVGPFDGLPASNATLATVGSVAGHYVRPLGDRSRYGLARSGRTVTHGAVDGA